MVVDISTLCEAPHRTEAKAPNFLCQIQANSPYSGHDFAFLTSKANGGSHHNHSEKSPKFSLYSYGYGGFKFNGR